MKTIIKYVVFSIIILATSSPYTQEAESLGQLKLEKRQPDVSMTVTSVNLGREESTITAEADMEAYGRVYATYQLAYDHDRQGGTVHVEGRGATNKGIMSGEGNGYWDLVDGVITMRFVAQIANGTVNLEISKFTPRTREMSLEIYKLK